MPLDGFEFSAEDEALLDEIRAKLTAEKLGIPLDQFLRMSADQIHKALGAHRAARDAPQVQTPKQPGRGGPS